MRLCYIFSYYYYNIAMISSIIATDQWADLLPVTSSTLQTGRLRLGPESYPVAEPHTSSNPKPHTCQPLALQPLCYFDSLIISAATSFCHNRLPSLSGWVGVAVSLTITLVFPSRWNLMGKVVQKPPVPGTWASCTLKSSGLKGLPLLWPQWQSRGTCACSPLHSVSTAAARDQW